MERAREFRNRAASSVTTGGHSYTLPGIDSSSAPRPVLLAGVEATADRIVVSTFIILLVWPQGQSGQGVEMTWDRVKAVVLLMAAAYGEHCQLSAASPPPSCHEHFSLKQPHLLPTAVFRDLEVASSYNCLKQH